MTDKSDIEFEPDELFGDAGVEDAESGGALDEAGPGCTGSVTRLDGALKDMIDDNFLQYASYVIRDRAIPDVEDGLKPVQRRIMHSLHENDDGKFTKVANIVGHTMQYHPHGDASIGDALVSLTNRRYLIEGQGNFGNIHTGDPAAASRYIECRLTELARNEIFNQELTEYVPSYDGRRKEPIALPAKLPLLLMLGAEGIAVGLSTKILPHNFSELIEAQIAILKKEPFKILPDFQQGGLMDAAEYEKGNGRIKIRARIEKKDGATLCVRELPFGTTTESLIASVEEAARKKKIGVKSISDFTAENVEIDIQLTADADAEKAIDALCAFTQCEVAVSPRAIVIRDQRPVEMNVDEILRHNTKRTVDILKKELQAERKRLLEELHRKTLVQIFVENRIYKKIEECRTYDAVKTAVLDGVNKFRKLLRRDVTQQDIEMLLGIPIKRISRFDMDKNRKDMDDIVKALDEAEKDLKGLIPYAVRYLKRLLKTYGDEYPRRTQLAAFEQVAVRDLTAQEIMINYDQERGYLGADVPGVPMFECSSYDKVILLWEDGRYQVMPPPDKLFVGKDLIYAAIFDKSKVMMIVYKEDHITYMKRFNFGGAIMNKLYRCAPKNSNVLLFADDQPGEIYVKYKKEKRLRILQQVYHTKDMPVRGAKARGAQMTVKTIRWIATRKPKGWSEVAGNPKGNTIDF
ncbi:MAG: DNA topoisomerase IV subunit A [Verrucomicrobia bacterium]|nr:DNA topoisomerase IV subunit A [Verrucomicrobiota bacterium]